VCRRDLAPARDVGDVDAGADDVGQRSAGFFQCNSDALSSDGLEVVVPETATQGPIRTAREYPTAASYSVPDETRMRLDDIGPT
jgi:hypothetical protein